MIGIERKTIYYSKFLKKKFLRSLHNHVFEFKNVKKKLPTLSGHSGPVFLTKKNF